MSAPARQPTRAIISTSLLSTPGSQIPPSSQSFDPLIKNVLSRRLTREIFPTSFGLCLAFWFFLGGSAGRLSSLRSMLTVYGMALSVLIWIVGVVPAVVARKRAMTADRTPAKTPHQSFMAALKNPKTIGTWALYLLSSLLSIALDTSHIRVFASSRKHPYYVNPQLLTYIIAQSILAGLYLGRNILLDRYVFKYPAPDAPTAKTKAASAKTLIITSLTALVLTALTIALTIPVLTVVLPSITFIVPILRPFLGHVGFKLAFWIKWTKVFRLSLGTVWAWELVDRLMDVIISKPILITSLVTPSNQLPTLVSGLTSPDPTFRYFAYRELRDIAAGTDPRSAAIRSTLFTSSTGTSSKGSTSANANANVNGTLWGTLVREALIQLGKDYQLVIRRGAPPPKATSAVVAPAPASTITPQKVGIEMHLKRDGSIFKGSPSTSTTPTRSPATPLASSSTNHDQDDIVPAIFRSVNPTPTKISPSPAPSPGPASKVPSKPLFSSLLAKFPLSAAVKRIHTLLPRRAQVLLVDVQQWWTTEREGKSMECMVPMREVDVLIIESLAHLISHSLTQDSFGVVQRNRDIPKVVEAFCSFLDEIQCVRKEKTSPQADASHPSPQHATMTTIDTIQDALKDGLTLIIRTFGDKLWKSYKLPPRTVGVLTAFGFIGGQV